MFIETRKVVKTIFSTSLVSLALAFSHVSLSQSDLIVSTVKEIENKLDARIGVAVTVIDSDEVWQYQGSDRFPMSSTFKTLACAALLSNVDSGLESLDRSVAIIEEDLVSYSPITENYVGEEGMTLSQLCEATITLSDNTAGNLVLEAIGGPSGLTNFIRSLGDNITQLQRWETELNEGIPGDTRDTTSPLAMAATLNKLLFSDVLSPSSRDQLESWLRDNAVGDALFRAGIPSNWEIGDKTGAGGYGSRSIAAVMWPPSHDPIIATVYITETEASFEDRNAAIAEIGSAIARAIAD